MTVYLALRCFEWVIYIHFRNMGQMYKLQSSLLLKITFKLNARLFSMVTFQLINYFQSIQNSEEPFILKSLFSDILGAAARPAG